MRLEESTPRCSLAPLWGRVEAVIPQDVGDRSSANPMPEVAQSTLDSGISPTGILSSHANGQLRDHLHDPWSPLRSTFVCPLLRNKLPMPAEECVGRDDRSDVRQGTSADGLSSYSQPTSLVVGEAKSSATELLLENSILFAEVLDDRILLLRDPAGQGGDEDLPWMEHRGHSVIVAALRDLGQLSGETVHAVEFP